MAQVEDGYDESMCQWVLVHSMQMETLAKVKPRGAAIFCSQCGELLTG